MEKKQTFQKHYFDRSHTHNKRLLCNQVVWVKSHKDSTNKWSHGSLLEPKGSKTWLIEINTRNYLVHTDQIRPASHKQQD